MNLKLRFAVSSVKIDAAGLSGKLHGKALGQYAAAEWVRLITPYVPYKLGALAGLVVIEPWQIRYVAPYARAHYYGDFKHRKDQHPKATKEWDKKAEPTQKPLLISALQEYIDSGRLNLNG